MTFLSEWLSNFSLSVRANTAAIGVVPTEVVFGAVAGSKTGHALWGALGARLGACIGLLLGLNWTGVMVWPAVIGVLQIRKRFDVRLWKSSLSEAGRRREPTAVP